MGMVLDIIVIPLYRPSNNPYASLDLVKPCFQCVFLHFYGFLFVSNSEILFLLTDIVCNISWIIRPTA